MEGSSKVCCTRELSAEQKFTKFPQYARRRFKSFCSRVTIILCTSGCFLHVCGQRKLIAYHNKLINICMCAYIVYANTYFWYADSSRVRQTLLSCLPTCIMHVLQGNVVTQSAHGHWVLLLIVLQLITLTSNFVVGALLTGLTTILQEK